MANKFVFDVDGTLTPSRRSMDADFQRWFLEFVFDHDVYLVTGSDYSKTLEQIGKSICQNVNKIYNCNGNDVWANGINVCTNSWRLPDNARDWLCDHLTNSSFPLRTGLHFEHRPGMCNFSIVGRNADMSQRKQYVEWDKEYNERDYIAHNFNLIFSDLQATVGGETGLDIAPKGCDKSQILKDFSKDDFILFFGDKMDKGGNDEPLATALFESYQGVNHKVKGWEHTQEILKGLYL